MLIEREPRLGGRGDLRLLEELEAVGEAPVAAVLGGIIANAEATKEGVHGHAPIAACPTLGALGGRNEDIGRALVNPHGPSGILAQDAIGHPGIIGNTALGGAGADSPSHDVVHPVIVHFLVDGLNGLTDTIVVGHRIIVVGGV